MLGDLPPSEFVTESEPIQLKCLCRVEQAFPFMNISWEMVSHIDEADRVESKRYSTNQTNVRSEHLSQE